MLLQPHLWLQGLLPVALVAGGALWWKQADIERDLSERTSRAIAAVSPMVDGKPWANVTVVGRDVTIAGQAPADLDLSRSETLAEGTFGVRLARVPAGLLPEANPFGWSARRDGQKISLSGFVATDGSRARIVEAARQALPGGEIVDQMISARNVPPSAAETAVVALAQLGRLANGSVSLAGSTLRITGGGADAATQAAISSVVAGLPQGASPSRVVIDQPDPPPTVPPAPGSAAPAPSVQAPATSQTASAPTTTAAPLTAWTATKSGTGVVLGGSIASEDARRRILAAARAATAGRITDGMTVAANVAPAAEAQAIAILRQMADLTAAQATISDKAVSLSGQASDPDGYARLSVTPLRPIEGFSLGAVEITPPRVELFSWRARKRDNMLMLDGLAPSSNERIAVLTEAAAGGLRVVDEMRVATGLLPGIDYGKVTGALVAALARLSDGSVEISGSRVAVTGRAPDAATADAIRAGLALLGAPLTVTTDISLVPPAPPSVPGPVAAIAPAAVPSAAAPAAPIAAAPGAVPPGAVPPVAANPATPPAGSPAPVAAVAAPGAIDCGPRIAAAIGADRLLFDYWKSDPRSEAAPAFDRLAAAMRGCRPPTKIEVSGHADIRNVSNSNQILSELRARAVRDELIRRGVDPAILIAVGYAATRPIVPNDTEEHMAQNRRVDITDLTGR
ncbi:OmpA family protein [Phreatobacter aquaticus]|uniref:OmpA family protein n=1 Tax=Phreatobacter aquaticus TaxID=2570229 RepID=A0A4D7QG04_9HYPH|nr:OmpA family protein [Phreatobacter aquaticus]QCK84404.1 OmpA family protein [Phreatobacter aquaticus]